MTTAALSPGGAGTGDMALLVGRKNPTNPEGRWGTMGVSVAQVQVSVAPSAQLARMVPSMPVCEVTRGSLRDTGRA